MAQSGLAIDFVMRISTWNINGLRSGIRAGFEAWLRKDKGDLICLQEVKTQEDLLTRSWFAGYETFWNTASRPGYSGVATLVADHLQPLTIELGIGDTLTDPEGRVLTVEFAPFAVINAYAPHSHRLLTRLEYKRSFCKHFLLYLEKRRRYGKPLIIVGDLNVAHEDIDLSNPRANQKNAGFLPEERKWFSDLLRLGFIDAFRIFETGGGHYTWWSMRNGVRERNVGWRLDYVLVDECLRNCVRSCFHSKGQFGSDHCPVSIDLDI